jgi:hypothetical protein
VVIGTVKNPTIPMSWNSGSHDTITSRLMSSLDASTIPDRFV